MFVLNILQLSFISVEFAVVVIEAEEKYKRGFTMLYLEQNDECSYTFAGFRGRDFCNQKKMMENNIEMMKKKELKKQTEKGIGKGREKGIKGKKGYS